MLLAPLTTLNRGIQRVQVIQPAGDLGWESHRKTVAVERAIGNMEWEGHPSPPVMVTEMDALPRNWDAVCGRVQTRGLWSN